MSTILSLHGATGVALLCLLLFIEEAGVPLPLAPGDAILIAAGVLIANDSIPLPVFLICAYIAVLGGAFVGYTWTRALGMRGLMSLAERLHIDQAVDRVSARLHASGPLGIAIGRLVPGMRINTTLVAGALGIARDTFLLGVAPAAIVWVTAFTVVGMLVGLPAQHFLGSFGKMATDGALLLLAGVIGFLSLRHIPPVERQNNAFVRVPELHRLVLALLVDLAIVTTIVLGLAALIRAGIGIFDLDGFVDLLVIVLVSVLTYAIAARRGTGVTGGEALLNLTYRAPRVHRRSESASG
jgi:membrane-associated protein